MILNPYLYIDLYDNDNDDDDGGGGSNDSDDNDGLLVMMITMIPLFHNISLGLNRAMV